MAFSPIKTYSKTQLMRMEQDNLSRKVVVVSPPKEKIIQTRIQAPYISAKPIKGSSNKST